MRKGRMTTERMIKKSKPTRRMQKESSPDPERKSMGTCHYHMNLSGWMVKLSVLIMALPWVAGMMTGMESMMWMAGGMTLAGMILCMFGLWTGSMSGRERRSADLVIIPAVAFVVGLILVGDFAFMAGYAKDSHTQMQAELDDLVMANPNPDGAMMKHQQEMQAGIDGEWKSMLFWRQMQFMGISAAMLAFAIAALMFMPRRYARLCSC